MTDTSDPVWRDAAVGYLVLRFFDQWLEEGATVMAQDPGFAELTSRVRVDPDIEPKARDLLLTAVQAMSGWAEANPALVAEPLLAYGKYLESAGRLILAAHMYATMIAALDTPDHIVDPLSAITAHMYYAFVTRVLGQFDASRNAYQRADAISQQIGTLALTLRARIGLTSTLKACGNLGDAETLLDCVLAEATAAGLAEAQAGALHNRGCVRNLRGHPVEGMQDLFRAYQLTNDSTHREVILGDLAACAGDAGYWNVARDANRKLAYTAHVPVVRSAALGNLLERAALDGDATEFEQLLEHIDLHAKQHPLPAEHVIHIQLYTAYGIERFGPRAAAIEAYRTVMTQAHDAGLHQVAFEAEHALNTLLEGTNASC